MKMDPTSQSPSSSPNAVPPVSPADSTPPPQSNTTQLTDQLPPPLSPPFNSSVLSPQSTPTPPPTASQSPPFAPPPTSSSSPPPLPSAPPPSITSPPSPPQPSGVPPPEKSPPQTVSPSPPHPSPDAAPPTGTMKPPPPHDAMPPKHFPPLPPPTFASPPAPPTTSHLPESPSPPSIHLPPHLNSSFVNGSTIAPHHPTLPTEKPLAGSTHSGRSITTDTIAGNSSGAKAGSIAAVSTVVGFLVLTLVVLAVWLTHRKKKRKDLFTLHYGMPSTFASPQKSDLSIPRSYYLAQVTGSQSMKNFIYSPDDSMGGSRSCFTYEELFGATNGFSSNNILGEGGFGCVYKGVLVNGREVAVKQLKVGGGQGEREFRAEVEIISRIHHKHLVSLVGSCIAGSQRMLVYDFVANDTLHHHLHGKETPVMDWASRVKAAAGAARGLAYLHEDCQPRIIHRDIKSTNILLDNNFEAQVADFGLAKLALELDLHTHVSTRVMGTFGYLAPEYAASGKLTEKSDVYSFGVVLLELITGRKPVDASRSLGDESLVEWARPLLSQALETEDFGKDLIDYRLEKNFIASEMLRMLEAAAACVRHSASKRPRMSQVVRALNCMDELADLNNGMKPGQSGVFDSREHSAEIRMFRRMAFGSQEYSSSEIFNNSQTSWRTNL